MADIFRHDWLKELPVVGILRGFDREAVEQIALAAGRGGLRHLEITMNTPGAAELIELARNVGGDRMNIGAGTVLNEQHLEQALQAGAQFIVMPVVHEGVMRVCRQRAIPVFPGALTPTEIVRAWELGATMVKVFPSDGLGPGYIRSLKAPLPQIRLMPTGGVTLSSFADFIKAGADGVGVGSPLFNAARVKAKDWDWIEAQCRAFAEAYAQADTV